MNLKQAAAELNVHYQTAYKWVREGALAAVRIGARYEISDEAVAAFQARRRSYVRAASAVEAAETGPQLTAEDLIGEAESMLLDPLLSTRAVATYAARRCSEAFDALCFVSLCRHDGTRISAYDHPRADWITFVASLRDLAPMDADALGRVVAPIRAGRSICLSHVPVDEFARWMRPEMRQYVDRYAIRSLLGAPITAPGGVNGLLVLTRNGAAPAFNRRDEAVLTSYGVRLGELVATAHETRNAWDLRAEVAAAISAWSRRQFGPLYAGDAQRIIDAAAARSRFGVCIFDRAGYLIAANPAFVRGARMVSADAPIGLRFEEMVDPEYRPTERGRWERLVSGAADYDDIQASRLLDGDTLGRFGFHRCAVRRPDGTVAAVVSIARRLRGAPDPELLRRLSHAEPPVQLAIA